MKKIFTFVNEGNLKKLPFNILKQFNKNSQIMEKQLDEKKFHPKGAIAFFVLLLILDAIIWFSHYYILISKN